MTSTIDARRRLIAMRTLMIDAAAVEAHHYLAEAGVTSLLLKGRILATWLWKGELREYGDVDLLVAPSDRDAAVDALAGLGYRHWLAGAANSEYGSNEVELVRPHGPCIDLHHTLIGITAEPEESWHVLSARVETWLVAGKEVVTLDETARTMHLALHLAQNGLADVKARRDLELGLQQLSDHQWLAAAGLAESVGAEEAFSGGLRLVEPGPRIADFAGLPEPRDVGLLLRISSAPQESLQIDNLVRAESQRARARLILRKLWPTEAYMVGRDPRAGLGRSSLVRARLHRMAGLPTRFLTAFRSWRDASRQSRAVSGDAAESSTKGPIR